MQISPGSQVLLDNAERYGLYLARSLNDTNPAQVLSRENIGIITIIEKVHLCCLQSLWTVHAKSSIAAFLFTLYYPVINAKQIGTKIDISSSNNEVFPMEEDLVNFTRHISPAQISIPPQVLLGAVSRSSSDGEHKNVN